jgi:hypothetical protein
VFAFRYANPTADLVTDCTAFYTTVQAANASAVLSTILAAIKEADYAADEATSCETFRSTNFDAYLSFRPAFLAAHVPTFSAAISESYSALVATHQ